jgi:multiple sugar transport system permease protein
MNAAAARKATGYLVLTAFALMFLYPFVLSTASTFKSRAEVVAHPVLPWPLDPSSRAWENILVHSDFPLWTLNSIMVTVMATLLRLFLDSLAGYSLARLRWRGRGLVFTFVLAVLAVPPIVLTIPRFLVLKEMGLLNSYAGLVLPLAVDAVGIFIMKQFFESLPPELEEAARIDGANIFQTFWRIILPLARPGLITLTILSFQGTWNEFLLPLIYLQSQDKFTLALGLRMFQGESSTSWHLLMAASLLTMLPVVILFFFSQRHFMRGIVFTGVKG